MTSFQPQAAIVTPPASPPWSLEDTYACFTVRDANGQARGRTRLHTVAV